MAVTKISDLATAVVTDLSEVHFAVDQTDLSATRSLTLADMQTLGPSAVVDTVADLATATPRDGQLWQTRGYYIVGDGGANRYRYDVASTDAVDGGWVINGPSSVGRYLAVDRTIVNVKHFGAVGDGIADDGPEVSLALAAATDGRVFFPVGVYLLTTYTKFSTTGHLDVIGETTSTEIVGPGNTVDFLEVNEGHNVTISSLRFNTFRAPVDLPTNTNPMGELRLYDVTATNCLYLLADAGDGVNPTLNTLIVHRCNGTGLQRGIMWRGDVLGMVSVRNCRFVNTSITGDQTSAIWIGSNTVTTSADNVEISYNFIDGVTTTANSVDAHGILFYGNKAHIIGNTVMNVSNGNNGDNAEGIYTKQTRGSIAFNTVIDGGSSAGIACKGTLRSGSAPFGHSVVVHGNTILHDDAAVRSEYGIKCFSEDVVVTGNHIEGTRGGIFLQASGFVCNDNRILDCNTTTGAAGIVHQAIADNATPNGGEFSICGNVVTGITATAGVAYGIHLRCPGQTNPGDIANGTISGNTLVNFSATSNSQGIRLETSGSGGISHVAITGNTIGNVTRVVQFADVTSGDINNILFADNKMHTFTVLFQDASDVTALHVDVTAAGAPAIIASPGSVYKRTDGGAGTSFYVKESGEGASTGWVGK